MKTIPMKGLPKVSSWRRSCTQKILYHTQVGCSLGFASDQHRADPAANGTPPGHKWRRGVLFLKPRLSDRSTQPVRSCALAHPARPKITESLECPCKLLKQRPKRGTDNTLPQHFVGRCHRHPTDQRFWNALDPCVLCRGQLAHQPRIGGVPDKRVGRAALVVRLSDRWHAGGIRVDQRRAAVFGQGLRLPEQL